MSLLCIQKIFRRKDGELTVFGRLAAGACAGMTSTLVIYFFIYFLANAHVFLVWLVRCGNTDKIGCVLVIMIVTIHQKIRNSSILTIF